MEGKAKQWQRETYHSLLLLCCVPAPQLCLLAGAAAGQWLIWSWRSALLPQKDEILTGLLLLYFSNTTYGYPAEHIHAFQLLFASLFGICLHENLFPSRRGDLLYIWRGSLEQYFFHWSHFFFFFFRVIWGFRNICILVGWYTCAADGVEKWGMCGAIQQKMNSKIISKSKFHCLGRILFSQ